jgi:hypothetical protein
MLSDWLNPITLPLFKTICDSDLRAPQHCERRIVCVALRPLAADVANRSQLIPERHALFFAGIEIEFAPTNIEIAEPNEFVQIRRSSA